MLLKKEFGRDECESMIASITKCNFMEYFLIKLKEKKQENLINYYNKFHTLHRHLLGRIHATSYYESRYHISIRVRLLKAC